MCDPQVGGMEGSFSLLGLLERHGLDQTPSLPGDEPALLEWVSRSDPHPANQLLALARRAPPPAKARLAQPRAPGAVLVEMAKLDLKVRDELNAALREEAAEAEAAEAEDRRHALDARASYDAEDADANIDADAAWEESAPSAPNSFEPTDHAQPTEGPAARNEQDFNGHLSSLASELNGHISSFAIMLGLQSPAPGGAGKGSSAPANEEFVM